MSHSDNIIFDNNLESSDSEGGKPAKIPSHAHSKSYTNFALFNNNTNNSSNSPSINKKLFPYIKTRGSSAGALNSSKNTSNLFSIGSSYNNLTSEKVSLSALEKGFEAKLFPNNNVLPKIQVLLVEDNIINQIILSRFLRKNNIPYTLISNGKDALKEWRTGGYQLILLDMQLPYISGIYIAKEIRRLEKINGIGITNQKENSYDFQSKQFKRDVDEETLKDKKLNLELKTVISNSSNESSNKFVDQTKREDSPNPLSGEFLSDRLDVSKFQQPVIIVALTANSFTEDRDNALAAGCNDFLVKPVNLVWLSKKFAEWGCIQALINFDNWEGALQRQNDQSEKETEKQSRVNSTLKKLLKQVEAT